MRYLVLLIVALASAQDYWSDYTDSPEGPPHTSRQCSQNLANLWLDVVVIIDSTRGAGSSGFGDEIGFIAEFFGTVVTVSQNPRYTRLAIISAADNASVIANLTTYNSSQQVLNSAIGIQYANGANLNLADALSKAEGIFNDAVVDRPNAKKAVFLYSSLALQCTTSKLKNWESLAVDDYCRLVGQFRGNDWPIISVALKFFDTQQFPTIDLGWPCYVTKNDDNLFFDISYFLTQINCFCQQPTTQFVADACSKYAECIHLQDIKNGYVGAQTSCHQQNHTLTDIYSSAKELFLRNLAINAGGSTGSYLPFWAGLSATTGSRPFYWDSGEQLQSNDYNNFLTNPPSAVSGGDCVSVYSYSGFATKWQVSSCSIASSRFSFFCQSSACDSDNYCL